MNLLEKYASAPANYCGRCGHWSELDPITLWCDTCYARWEAAHMTSTGNMMDYA